LRGTGFIIKQESKAGKKSSGKGKKQGDEINSEVNFFLKIISL
jgi:hypothetical protein